MLAVNSVNDLKVLAELKVSPQFPVDVEKGIFLMNLCYQLEDRNEILSTINKNPN